MILVRISLIKKKEKKDNLKAPANGAFTFYNNPFCIKYSAICTALVAAPFLRLSETTHMFKVFGCVSSLLNLPTNTSSLSCASIGIGYCCVEGSSTNTTPGADCNNDLISLRS